MIGVLLLWSYFTDNLGVRDLVAMVMGDVIVGNRFECVRPIDVGFCWVSCVGAHTLAQASKFVGVRGVPDGLVFGVASELAMVE